MARFDGWSPPPSEEPVDERELLFENLLERAMRAPLTMQGFFDSERPALDAEERGMRTLRLEEIEARRDFLSAVLLLGSPYLSWGAERHVLGVLEAYADVAWITGALPADRPATPTGRAACIDLGRARTQLAAWGMAGDDPARIQAAEREVEQAVAEHGRTGCACPGRDKSLVIHALRELTAGTTGSCAALPDVWTMLSVGMAGAGAARLIAPPKGDALAGAPYTHRSLLLCTLLHAYGTLAEWILGAEHPSHAEMMAHVTSKLLEAPEMLAALDGTLDATGPRPARGASSDPRGGFADPDR